MERNRKSIGLTIQTLARVPAYIKLLATLKNKFRSVVSVKYLSNELRIPFEEIQEDLESFHVITSSTDIYDVNYLLSNIERAAGLDCMNEVFVMGTGELLDRVLDLDEFKEGLFKTIAIFTDNVTRLLKTSEFTGILPLERVGEMCGRMKVKTGVLAVEEKDCAGEVFRLLVASGIRYIINFSPFQPKELNEDITLVNCQDLNLNWFTTIMPAFQQQHVNSTVDSH